MWQNITELPYYTHSKTNNLRSSSMKNVKTWNSYSRQNCKCITKTHSTYCFSGERVTNRALSEPFGTCSRAACPGIPISSHTQDYHWRGLSKHVFVATKVCLSRQNVCRDKSRPHFCRDKIRTTKLCLCDVL